MIESLRIVETAWTVSVDRAEEDPTSDLNAIIYSVCSLQIRVGVSRRLLVLRAPAPALVSLALTPKS